MNRYLLRHGEIDSGVQPPAGRRMVGQIDLPLTETGRFQARRWRRWFAAVGLERIVASDLQRTWETATIVGEGCGIYPEPEPLLREVGLGVFDGLPFSEVRRKYPEEWACRGADMANFRPTGGESFRDLADRVFPAFQRISEETDGAVLMVVHAGVIRTLVCQILAVPLEHLFRIEQDFAALTVVSGKTAPFTLRRLNVSPAEIP